MGHCVVQGPEQIKKEIIKNGPIVSPMTPYTDFLTYRNGTYFPGEGAFKFNGQGIVKIVGWDKGPTGDVWIIENSWGPEWGDNGYAQVISGNKEVGLDFIGIAPQVVHMTTAEWENTARQQEEQMQAQQAAGGVSVKEEEIPLDTEEAAEE